MKRLISSIILSLSVAGFANAKTPPEVMIEYKAYRKALKSKDYKTASDHAYNAWRKAEELMGDSETTGSLAQNYGDLGLKAELKYKPVRDAYFRSIELTSEPEERLAMESAFALFASRKKKTGDFKKRFDDIVTFANANNLENSTFLGEIYTIRAETYNQISNKKNLKKHTGKALEIFENSTDGYVSAFPLLAQLYAGYADEYEEDLIPALMNYQIVMENTEQALPENHPFVSKALGRWMLMRSRIKRKGLTKEAEEAGMCECWPYDKPRNESVQPIKRKAGDMPSKAWISGYVIVEFDLEDDGKVKDPRILTSWPPELYDKTALRAMSSWEYSARTSEESDEDRKDIITTMRYMLTDQYGNVIE